MDKELKMNINESCILNFLLNPDELDFLTGVFQQNINEIESKFNKTKDIAYQNRIKSK